MGEKKQLVSSLQVGYFPDIIVTFQWNVLYSSPAVIVNVILNLTWSGFAVYHLDSLLIFSMPNAVFCIASNGIEFHGINGNFFWPILHYAIYAIGTPPSW